MLIRWWLLCQWRSKAAWKRKREETVNFKRITRFYKYVVSCNFWKQIKHRETVCSFRCIYIYALFFLDVLNRCMQTLGISQPYLRKISSGARASRASPAPSLVLFADPWGRRPLGKSSLKLRRCRGSRPRYSELRKARRSVSWHMCGEDGPWCSG